MQSTLLDRLRGTCRELGLPTTLLYLMDLALRTTHPACGFYERLVGCIWFVREHYVEDEVRADYWLPTDGSCVWDFDVFVAESERLGFLFAKLCDTLDARLRAQGVTSTVSRINGFNQRSLASHRSLGAADCGWALFLRLGLLEVMLSSLRPHFRGGLRKRPALWLAPRHPGR